MLLGVAYQMRFVIRELKAIRREQNRLKKKYLIYLSRADQSQRILEHELDLGRPFPPTDSGLPMCLRRRVQVKSMSVPSTGKGHRIP